MDQSHKMDTDEFQFLSSFAPEHSQLSDQFVPENDAESFFRTSPLSSASYRLHLLRLSSDSDDCFENLSPFSSCSMEFEITEENQCQREEQFKEHPSEIIFDSVLEMEIGNDGVAVATARRGEESRRPRSNRLDPHSDANPAKKILRPTGQPNAKHRNSGKDRRPLRKNSNRKGKKKNDTGRPTTDQKTDSSHFTTPPSSHLAGSRKLRPPPSQHMPQAISPEQYSHIRCPVPPKSPRKSPVLTPRKINQSTHKSKTPRHVPIQGEHFVFPEISEVPRQSTKKTCVGSEEAYKQNTETSTHGQCEETFHERNRKATIPSLPKICQSHQRRQSREHVGTSVESCAVAPQSPQRSPRSHAAKLESPSPLCTSEGETSVLDPNAVPSISVICPTSNPALRQKFERGISNILEAESREKSTKRNGICSQEPRLLSRPTLSPDRSNQLSRASKSPRSAMTNNNYFAYPDVRVPRPPTRGILLGSSGTFMARQESQRSSNSNGATHESPLSPAVSPNRFSCPAPQKSPKKPTVGTRKNMRSTRAAKTPKSASGKDSYFVYPEIPQEPRPPTTRTRVGTATMLEEQGKIKPSNQQTVTSEKQGETPKKINSSVPSLPKIPNVQPTKQDLRKKREKTLLEICNELSSQKRTV